MISFPNAPAVKAAPTPSPPRPMSEYGPGTAAAKVTAKKLEDLATRGDHAERGRQLRSLAAALRDPDEALLWREVPLHDAFAGLEFEPEPRSRSRLLQPLHMLRGAVIFLPLLVSWWGIHGAVSAYGQRLAADPDQGAQTFFREWLGGFGGDLWLSFDRMAAVIVGCVLALIAVSIASEWLQRRAIGEEAELRGRFDYALTEAALHLRAAPGATTEDAERQLKEMVSRSADLIQALLDAVNAVQGELSELEASSGEFRTVITGLEGGARSIAAATHKLDTTVSNEQNRAAQAFHDAGTAAAAEIAAAADGLRTGIAEQQDQASQVLTQVGAAVTEAVGQGERHRDALGRIMRDGRDEDARALAEAIAQRQGQLADELRRAGEDIAAKLTGAVEIEVDQRLRAQLDAIGQTNRQLNIAVDALAQSVHHLGQTLGQTNLPVPVQEPPKPWYKFGR
ncbi:hypothetical protein [Glycomyces buryatensis]|uniref:Uncharacterized protein n=1 Tax=Glycomyces buryatensis TaxID=2570927 RepID=A0A4S8QFY1_9ACTN|nr:hypothetical protein [Glycomyces buryatensis]THV43280.1 hypothetical protein FAB82_02100 [Glycomyces buryatensis]